MKEWFSNRKEAMRLEKTKTTKNEKKKHTSQTENPNQQARRARVGAGRDAQNSRWRTPEMVVVVVVGWNRVPHPNNLLQHRPLHPLRVVGRRPTANVAPGPDVLPVGRA